MRPPSEESAGSQADPAQVIRYTRKQKREIAEAYAARHMLANANLRISLRGRALCDVIRAWHEANRPTNREEID